MDFEDILVNTANTRRTLGGVSAMWIWRRLKDDPTFPKPIQFSPGGPRFWKRSELLEWIEAHRLGTAVK